VIEQATTNHYLRLLNDRAGGREQRLRRFKTNGRDGHRS
jgi:hypothetical protein